VVVHYAVEPSEEKYGYFYSLLTARDDDMTLDRPDPNLIECVEPLDEEGEDLLNVRPMGFNYVTWSRCGHRELGEYYLGGNLEYISTREVGNLCWYRDGYGLVCNRDLAIRLLTSNLRGLMVDRPGYESPGGLPEPKDWYRVQGVGPHAYKVPKMTPEPYKCWNCQKEPVCSVCGRMGPLCPYCDVEYHIPVKQWDGKETKMLVYVPPPSIIDLERWDGSDLFGLIITHRMLQFLMSCQAHPFRAFSIPVDVKGASAKNVKRLEMARMPI